MAFVLGARVADVFRLLVAVWAVLAAWVFLAKSVVPQARIGDRRAGPDRQCVLNALPAVLCKAACRPNQRS